MKKLVLLLPLLVLFSCKDTVVNQMHKDFAENQWLKTQAQEFEFDLKKDIQKGDLVLNFSHIYEPGYSTVPLTVSITTPDGKSDMNMLVNLKLKDEDGESLSDCDGDICDFQYTLRDDAAMPKGKYKVTIQNGYQWEYLPNVLSVGIAVQREE